MTEKADEAFTESIATPADHETQLVEKIATDATEHTRDRGWKVLLEPYTHGSLWAISLTLFAGSWGFSVPAAVLLFIQADIGHPHDVSSFFSIVWTVGLTVGFMLVGHLSDILGRRWIMISFNVLGFIGGIVSGTAHNLTTLNGANILIGLATGAQYTHMVTATEVLQNRHKTLGMALVCIIALPATGCGAYMARALVETASWRWIYYIYCIIVACGTALFAVFYFPTEVPSTVSWSTKLKRVDYFGIFLGSAGLVCFILGISLGNNPYPWKSAKVICLLVIGALTLVGFVLYEVYSPMRAQFFLTKPFRDLRGYTAVTICSSIGGIAYTSLNIIWPTQVNQLYGTNRPWQTIAWYTTTVGFGVWGGLVFLGPLWGKVGHVKWQLVISNVWMTAFSGALAHCRSDTLNFSLACSFLAALPVGYIEEQGGALIQLLAPGDHQLGSAFGTMSGVRFCVGSIGTAIFLAILHGTIPTQLQKHVTSAALDSGLPESSLPDLFAAIGLGTGDALTKVPGITPAIISRVGPAVTAAYEVCYSYVYYTALAFGIVAIGAALMLRPVDYLLTEHVPKRIVKNGIGVLSAKETV